MVEEDLRALGVEDWRYWQSKMETGSEVDSWRAEEEDIDNNTLIYQVL